MALAGEQCPVAAHRPPEQRDALGAESLLHERHELVGQHRSGVGPVGSLVPVTARSTVH